MGGTQNDGIENRVLERNANMYMDPKPSVCGKYSPVSEV